MSCFPHQQFYNELGSCHQLINYGNKASSFIIVLLITFNKDLIPMFRNLTSFYHPFSFSVKRYLEETFAAFSEELSNLGQNYTSGLETLDRLESGLQDLQDLFINQTEVLQDGFSSLADSAAQQPPLFQTLNFTIFSQNDRLDTLSESISDSLYRSNLVFVLVQFAVWSSIFLWFLWCIISWLGNRHRDEKARRRLKNLQANAKGRMASPSKPNIVRDEGLLPPVLSSSEERIHSLGSSVPGEC